VTQAPERRSPAWVPSWAGGSHGWPGLERQLEHLDAAIDAAEALGIDVTAAERVRDDARGRLGFPADVYVLALVGGTGVGKSSLLNALAGREVSPASVRRPTTDEAVAWVPHEARTAVAELLEWLGIRIVEEHESRAATGVAVVDLPDMDSRESEHRARVEAILPRVDAVVWVSDPEKYHDAVLHDEFLRAWLPRLATQAFVVNKSDRLTTDGIDQIRRDVVRGLRHVPAVPGRGKVPVLVTSAVGGADGLRELTAWLAAGIETKRVVRARLTSAIVSAIDDLAAAGGVDPVVGARPFLDSDARTAAIASVTAAVLRAVDLPGLERQAVAATRARARARGTGPIGLVTSAIYRWSGREARVADPNAFLVRWRERSSLAPAVERLRTTVIEPVRVAAPQVRPALATAIDADRLRDGLEASVDRALDRHDRAVPSSRAWPLLGMLQTLATAGVALSVVWIVVWILARPPVDLLDVPLLGAVPMPLVALAGSLLAGYLLARLLGWHAGWLGRRWSGRLRHEITAATERQLADGVLGGFDRLERARRALWAAARAATEDARRG
jgi:hypothetical protein